MNEHSIGLQNMNVFKNILDWDIMTFFDALFLVTCFCLELGYLTYYLLFSYILCPFMYIIIIYNEKHLFNYYKVIIMINWTKTFFNYLFNFNWIFIFRLSVLKFVICFLLLFANVCRGVCVYKYILYIRVMQVYYLLIYLYKLGFFSSKFSFFSYFSLSYYV